jgi:1-acyl-sn-glycerol-3-phosphate acyltransferase
MTLGNVLFWALIAALLFMAYRTGYWIWQGRKLQKTGYMPPPSTRFARWFAKRVYQIVCMIGVGPVKVIGAENAKFAGRALVLPNHQFALDFAVVGKAIPFSYRQVAKAKELRPIIRGTLAAWAGIVGVQVEGGKSQEGGGGQAVIDTGARIINASKGARLLLFPQGKLVFSNKISNDDFRTGAIRMVNGAAELGGDDQLYVLPVAVHYKRDRKDASAVHRFMNAIGFKNFRRWKDFELVPNADGTKTKVDRIFTTYGATVVIGKPMAAKDLPKDPRAATNAVAAEIQRLLTIAEKA